MHSFCVWNVLSEQCFILPLSNIIWISSPPPMLWLHQSDKIHPLPTRADINRTKYITHTHRHTCPMIWCGAQLMFILMSQPRLIDSNADGPDQFEMWSSITSIRRFISQSQYSISASLVSIISKLSNSSIDTSKSYPVHHRHHHFHSSHFQKTSSSRSSSVLNKSHVVSKCLEFHAQLLYQQPRSKIEQFQKLFYFHSLERPVVK